MRNDLYEVSRRMSNRPDTRYRQREIYAYDIARVFEEIVAMVNNGQTVVIPDFGSFFKQKRAPRTGRNIATGKPVPIPARTVLAFRASSKLPMFGESNRNVNDARPAKKKNEGG